MNVDAILPHLKEYHCRRLVAGVTEIESAIKAGVIKNALLVEIKDDFNRIIEAAAEAFLDSGPCGERDGVPHNKSRWWLAAYDVDALANGAHTLPAVLRRAEKSQHLDEYAAFLRQLMPLREMLEAAKPLAAKKGDARIPVVKTAEQLEREARSMTCQCCGRAILANMGTIAHHGYERPGHGWQTGSCVGAKELPFEVSRERLGAMINDWRQRRKDMRNNHSRIKLEVMPIDLTFEDRTQKRDSKGLFPIKTVEVTRASFDAVKAERKAQLERFTFDRIKEDALERINAKIASITQAINEQQERYDGWKQTHEWSGSSWKEV